ncbi:MAG: CotH kinase family protein [Myxococcales bacterium]|nr:CotH kinase family protein [Myxococcales bacterium]
MSARASSLALSGSLLALALAGCGDSGPANASSATDATTGSTGSAGSSSSSSSSSTSGAGTSTGSTGGGESSGATTSGGSTGSSGGATTSGAESTSAASASTGEVPPDMPPPIHCDPDGGGPYWLLEGESLEVPITCLTGIELAGEDFTIEPLPAGASYDPVTATLHWTPGLDQGAVYHLTITAVPADESAPLKIGVADRWDHPENVPVVDPLIYTEEYGLPVLHLDAAPEINANDYTPATIVYDGHTYVAEAKYRGAASLGYPKKSYTLKFAKEDKFSDLDVPFVNKRKVVLISTFDDNAYIRQRLAYEMWNALDPAHIQVQVYSGVVFVDNAYWGLYTFSDHVDGYLMEDHGLLQDGNLYKARNHDANFRLVKANQQPKVTPHDGLTKEEGFPLPGEMGAFDDLDALVTFVATATDADFLAQIDGIITRKEYEDWWIFVSLIMADDSAGKNSYHYHDPNGGLFRFTPWDFNDSFGQTWQTARKGFTKNPEAYTWANQLFTRFLALPTIGTPLRARYGAVLQDTYEVEWILNRVDQLIAEIDPSAHRDEGRWGALYKTYPGWKWRVDFTTYEEEVVYLKQWISDRWAFVDGLY